MIANPENVFREEDEFRNIANAARTASLAIINGNLGDDFASVAKAIKGAIEARKLSLNSIQENNAKRDEAISAANKGYEWVLNNLESAKSSEDKHLVLKKFVEYTLYDYYHNTVMGGDLHLRTMSATAGGVGAALASAFSITSAGLVLPAVGIGIAALSLFKQSRVGLGDIYDLRQYLNWYKANVDKPVPETEAEAGTKLPMYIHPLSIEAAINNARRDAGPFGSIVNGAINFVTGQNKGLS